MNCSAANKIDIVGFLSSIGINHKKETNKAFAYCAPYRNDQDASLFVFKADNKWHDYGTGLNGGLLDLVCKIYNADIPGALSILSGTNLPPQYLSFAKQEKSTNLNSSIEIKHIQPLQNRALIQYLESRGISFNLAAIYAKEVYYNTYEGQLKPFFAIGFENDKSGYELRNGFITKNFPKGFKGCIGKKTITTIPGNPEKLNVFEGFINFLSALVEFDRTEFKNTTIVLNSTSNTHHIYNILSNFSNVNLFLDNDPPGKEAVTNIQKMFPNAIDQAQKIYPAYNDFNDFICNINRSHE